MKLISFLFRFVGLLFYLALLGGYVMCIARLCSCDFNPISKAEILYGIGAITGLGVVIGWIDFGV